jgi:Tfp pilus assembly protein PilN
MTEQLTEERLASAPVPAGPVRIAWATVPRVNLLPIEIVEARQFRRIKVLLVAGVVTAILVAVAAVIWAQQSVSDANDELEASQAKVTRLNAEQAKYAAVPIAVARVDAAKTARRLAMGGDVLWYRYMNEVDGARPAGVNLSALSFALTYPSGAVGAPGDPLSSHSVGTISASGSAQTYPQVAAWLEALNKVTGLSSSTLNNATETTTGVTFGSGVVINSDALSHRYDKEGS